MLMPSYFLCKEDVNESEEEALVLVGVAQISPLLQFFVFLQAVQETISNMTPNVAGHSWSVGAVGNQPS